MAKTTPKKPTAKTKTTSPAKTKMAPTTTIRTRWLNWRLINLLLALFYAAQGIVILALGRGGSVPVTTTYAAKDTLASQGAGHTVLTTAMQHLANLNLAWLVAIFLFVSAIVYALQGHFLEIEYERNFKAGQSPYRYLGLAVSGGVMAVVIGFVSGISDLSTLIMLFALAKLGGFFWWLAERGKVVNAINGWWLYWTGVGASLVPWIIYAIYALSTAVDGAGVPVHVYAIYDSIFALFVVYAANLYLQRKQIGKWTDFAFGERLFVLIGFVAQSALAWQVFFGNLR